MQKYEKKSKEKNSSYLDCIIYEYIYFLVTSFIFIFLYSILFEIDLDFFLVYHTQRILNIIFFFLRKANL